MNILMNLTRLPATTLTTFLASEWVPALGCTEPASIALAMATATEAAGGEPESVQLTVDPKIFKNCHAVGIPNSGHRTGIRWAASIGAHLPDPSAGLECFRQVTPDIIDAASVILNAERVHIDVDGTHEELFIDAIVNTNQATGRAVIQRDHTHVVRVERNGAILREQDAGAASPKAALRHEVAALGLEGMVALAQSLSAGDEARLEEGIALNRAIAAHGLTLFPDRFVNLGAQDELTSIAKLVCAGVYARMWGEEFPVMSLAGSGNKGITASLPLALHGEKLGLTANRIHQALALTCLVTSAVTAHLGSLSAVCGCSNAAGIGLAVGLTALEGGDHSALTLAINNMVGNVSGMICDGAKIGCALKTMTAVDAAFRASALALAGLGIPPSDGIVGSTAKASLINLGRLAQKGMSSTDATILEIMREKL